MHMLHGAEMCASKFELSLRDDLIASDVVVCAVNLLTAREIVMIVNME